MPPVGQGCAAGWSAAGGTVDTSLLLRQKHFDLPFSFEIAENSAYLGRGVAGGLFKHAVDVHDGHVRLRRVGDAQRAGTVEQQICQHAH